MPSTKRNKIGATPKKLDWLTESIVPIILVSIIWPVHKFLEDSPYSYERALGSGDLFAIEFTLILSALVESSSKLASCNESKVKKELSHYKMWATFLTVLLLILYIVAKINSFTVIIQNNFVNNVDPRLFYVSTTSLIACILTLCFIYYGKSIIENNKL